MAKKTPSDKEEFCVYCGSVENLTDDHVPPSNVFPSPKPSTLITVRACKSCNAGASKHDEYFRNMLCLSQDVGESPEAQKHWAAIFRSFSRPQAQRMKNALLGSTHPVQAITWSGIHLGPRMGFDVNLGRIHRVIKRIVRGLYFWELNRRLPEGHEVVVHCDDSLKDQPREVLQQLQHTILLQLMAIPSKIIAPGVFFYRFHAEREQSAPSVWALTFYERKSFLAITGSKDLCVPRKDGAQVC